jgi:Zn-dependent protease/CBS domain-containing protein
MRAPQAGERRAMKWSARLGAVAGIDVYVHVTFLALIPFLAAFYWSTTGTLAGVLTGLALTGMLFVCVLLHEYGHALTARRFGIRTRHITLLPIGGLALLESIPKDPRQEILVALAGPAVNLAIAGLAFLALAAGGPPGAPFAAELTRMGFLPNLLAANLMLALFNLLPAFPMDGGRVLRALLSLRMDRVRATRTAATIGQALAVGLGLLGLYVNPMLILIAVFVWIGADAEASAVEADARLARQPAARAMITAFATVPPEAPLSRAVELTLAGTQKDFPVTDGERVVGVLTQGGILRGLRDHGPAAQVAAVMGPARTADAGATLAELFADIRGAEARLVCILRGGRLVGIVDLENIAEFLRIQAALAGR